MKVCTRCKINKENESFRTRSEQRRGRERFYYLNNTCRQCDCELRKEYYEKVKDIPEFKLKNRDRVKKYAKENRDIVIEKKREYRQTDKYKENRCDYIKKNGVKIKAQEKICKRRWFEKNRDQLTDMYVGKILTQRTPLSWNELPSDIIKLGRLQIICKRTLKIKENEPRGTTQQSI